MTLWLAALCLTAATVWLGRPPPQLRLARTAGAAAWPGTGTSRPSRRAGWLLAALVGTAVAGLGLSPLLIAALAVVAILTHRFTRTRQAKRRRAATSAAVVELTYAIAAELRAGRTSAEALRAVIDLAGPLTPAMQSAYAAVTIGADAAAELAAAADEPGAERLRPVAAAWAVAATSGAQVATALERLSEAMDDDDELRRELDAALAGPRATMLLLAGLPLVGLLLGQSVGAHPVQLLLHRPLGWALMAGAGLLDVAGVLLMRAIVSRAQAP